jgi:hypothetical protein
VPPTERGLSLLVRVGVESAGATGRGWTRRLAHSGCR